jgi:hypothetical protein
MSYIDDLEEVQALIQLYIDGSNGDVGKLEKAFHASSWMFGQLGTTRLDMPITQFFDMVQQAPGMAGPGYRAVIQSIDLSGDAGVAVLAETDYLGCDFVDYFNVARIDGRWQITNKTFAHTGGTPPPM